MLHFHTLSAGSAPLLASLFALCLILMTARPAMAVTVEERLAVLESKVSSLENRVSILEANVATQGTQIAALTDKLMHVSRAGSNLVITGANLHIVNGRGGTSTANGLGNLIVGYNEVRSFGNIRSGSHNVVLGAYQNFHSWGGFVAGFRNNISAPYASVSGGQNNTASAAYASVSGGGFNTASGFSAAVSGGGSNTANGTGASVSGGHTNLASGSSACVNGGRENLASAPYASLAGGRGRGAVGIYDWRAGGLSQDF